jgi:hypothetical protein
MQKNCFTKILNEFDAVAVKHFCPVRRLEAELLLRHADDGVVDLHDVKLDLTPSGIVCNKTMANYLQVHTTLALW